MRCFYSPDFLQDLPAGQAFGAERFAASRDMLVQGGHIRAEDIVEVGPAATHLLKRVHLPDYLRRIREGRLDLKEQIQLGLPVTQALYRQSSTEAEATRQACYAALSDGVAAVLAGGRHHAFQDHGEGACVFNDIAIAIRDLQVHRPGIRVMVVDTDAHQGDGTNGILAGDPNVFTYSIHVGQGRKTQQRKGSMDVETVRYVEGEMYLRQLFSSLAAALDVFSPDLVIWISGADNHRSDRHGKMMLEWQDLQRRDETILRAFLRNRIPVALLYGSGASRLERLTAELHSSTVATAARLQGEVWK